MSFVFNDGVRDFEPLRVQPSHVVSIDVWRSEVDNALHTTVIFEFAYDNDEYVCSCGSVSRATVNNWRITDTRIPLSQIEDIIEDSDGHCVVLFTEDAAPLVLDCSCPKKEVN